MHTDAIRPSAPIPKNSLTLLTFPKHALGDRRIDFSFMAYSFQQLLRDLDKRLLTAADRLRENLDDAVYISADFQGVRPCYCVDKLDKDGMSYGFGFAAVDG